MEKPALLCLGYGYIAQYFAERLMTEGWSIIGTTRQQEKMAAIKETGVIPLLWDDEPDFSTLTGAAAILVSTPPDEADCPARRAIHAFLEKNGGKTKWIGYLSTNGVYGDHAGAWVNEETPPRPGSDRARRRIAAENDWQALGKALNIPVIVFRLPGIYGPGRSALDTVRKGRARRIYKKDQVFSRAHADDIVQALYASLQDPAAGALFNIADDEPAPPQDIIEYACKLLAVEPPPLVPLAEANLSEMGRSFYEDNKRVSNQRMKERLGVNLAYPDYRKGLKAIFEAENGTP